MMKTKVWMLLFALTAVSASAQQLFLQLGGGLATHYNADAPVGSAKLAIGNEWEFGKQWSFAPALAFVGKGWQDADTMTPDWVYSTDGVLQMGANGQPLQRTDAEGNLMYSKMGRSTTTNYLQLDLPIHYYLRVGDHRFWRFTGGVYAAYGVGGRRRTQGDGREAGARKIEYHDATFTRVEGMRRWDAGLKVGVAYQFPSAFTFGAEVDFGALPVNRRSEDLSKVGRNVSAMLTLTYHFRRHKAYTRLQDVDLD